MITLATADLDLATFGARHLSSTGTPRHGRGCERHAAVLDLEPVGNDVTAQVFAALAHVAGPPAQTTHMFGVIRLAAGR